MSLREALIRQAPSLALQRQAADEIARLDVAHAALHEWFDKTAWIRDLARPRDLGKHLADVARDRIAALEAQLRDAREALDELTKHEVGLDFSEQVAQIDQVLAGEAPAAPVVQGWRPISTAPQDGTMFLVWVAAERWSAADGEGSGRSADVSDVDFCRWVSPRDDVPGYFDNMAGQIGDAQHVTHWMPIPAAPGSAAPAAPVVPAGLKVGNLPTLSDEDYPGLGEWWVQVWDGERVVCRAYGDTPQAAHEMAVKLSGNAAAPNFKEGGAS